MICLAFLLPCSPRLIPTIGREDLENFPKTITALKTVGQKIAKFKPEVILSISSKGPVLKDAFSLNLAQEYSINFNDFGDLTTKIKFKNDLELNYKIKERFETNFSNTPLIMVTESELTYHLAVPLYYIYQVYKNFSLIPIYSSSLNSQEHFNFGKKLREELTLTNKRICIIIPWQLENNKKEKNNLSYNKKILSLVLKKNIQKILKIKPIESLKASLNNFSALIILLGILSELNYQPKVLSQESFLKDFYTIINFKLL